MGTTAVLVAETSGNQAYVYRSNKLREAVGASHLLSQVGTTWLADALGADTSITTVVATSGKAILLGERSRLAEIAQTLTTRALVEAPGLDVTAGIADLDGTLFHSIRTAYRQLEANRSRLAGTAARFQRLPIVASCATTGAPANVFTDPIGSSSTSPVRRSLEAVAKRRVAAASLKRLGEGAPQGLLETSIDALDDEQPGQWIAVVHADGNGLGQLFLDFDGHLTQAGLGEVLTDIELSADAYRSLSDEVERCTLEAFREALARVADAHSVEGRLPRALKVVPVLLGGDDLTAVASGPIALDLVVEHVSAFARLTSESAVLRGLSIAGLSASASVVYTKPHFPYWSAYEMAADLLGAAKDRCRHLRTAAGLIPSVVDLHMVYDSSAADISASRSQRTAPDTSLPLWGGPYALDPVNGLAAVADLRSLAAEIRSSSSSSAVHDIRTRLTTSGVAAVRRRLGEVPALASLAGALADDRGLSMLIDAMDLNDVQSLRLEGAR